MQQGLAAPHVVLQRHRGRTGKCVLVPGLPRLPARAGDSREEKSPRTCVCTRTRSVCARSSVPHSPRHSSRAGGQSSRLRVYKQRRKHHRTHAGRQGDTPAKAPHPRGRIAEKLRRNEYSTDLGRTRALPSAAPPTPPPEKEATHGSETNKPREFQRHTPGQSRATSPSPSGSGTVDGGRPLWRQRLRTHWAPLAAAPTDPRAPGSPGAEPSPHSASLPALLADRGSLVWVVSNCGKTRKRSTLTSSECPGHWVEGSHAAVQPRPPGRRPPPQAGAPSPGDTGSQPPASGALTAPGTSWTHRICPPVSGLSSGQDVLEVHPRRSVAPHSVSEAERHSTASSAVDLAVEPFTSRSVIHFALIC